jgi:hypothetical protein
LLSGLIECNVYSPKGDMGSPGGGCLFASANVYEWVSECECTLTVLSAWSIDYLTCSRFLSRVSAEPVFRTFPCLCPCPYTFAPLPFPDSSPTHHSHQHHTVPLPQLPILILQPNFQHLRRTPSQASPV